MENEEYPVYGGCDSCEHQSEICTDCMKQNTMGEWVHSKYSPKPGVYTLPNQRQVTTEQITTKQVTA
jgi:hypothetical protein